MITIDDSNYELWLLRYAEQELTTEEREAVEAWLTEHPEAAEELALYNDAPRMQRDESIVYTAPVLQVSPFTSHLSPFLRWSAAAAVVAALMVPAIGGITEMESGEWRAESGELAQADLNEELIIKNEELPEEVRNEVSVAKSVVRQQEEPMMAEVIEQVEEPVDEESEEIEVLPTVPEVIYTDNLIVYEPAPDTVYTSGLIVYDDSRRSWTEDVKDWATETKMAQWMRRRFKAREAELFAMNE